MDVDAATVLAFRLAGQDLAAPAAGATAALRAWTIQDSPPGTAVAAVLARTAGTVPVGWLDTALFEERSLVALYNARTATAILPAGDVAAYATGMLPGDDDADLKAIVGPALPDVAEGFAEPVALAVAAIADALDGTTLSRDDLHEALRARLPAELLPWCKGCKSHHARRGVLVMAGLHGRLCRAGRVGRQPAFARTDQWTGWDAPDRATAGAELVRRYLTAYGPSTRQHFAQWAGLGTAHAAALWKSVADELTEVRADGAAAWVITRDLAALQDPPPARGVRLLAPGDPLLLGRDRAALVPDAVQRKRLFPAINAPGLVVADGAPAALWRGRKQGKALALAVEPLDGAPPVDPAALQAAAQRLAPHRGATSVSVATF